MTADYKVKGIKGQRRIAIPAPEEKKVLEFKNMKQTEGKGKRQEKKKQ